MAKKNVQNKSCFITVLRNNLGAFSPFMFGLLMGMAAFSTAIRYQAEQDLKNIQKQQKLMEKEQAEDVRRAFENAILTENVADGSLGYSKDLDLERARSFLSGSTGQTRTGQRIILKERKAGEVLGADQQRIVITASDDEFVRQRVETLGSSDALADFTEESPENATLFDSAAVRARQVKQSKEYLHMEEAQLYRYWGGHEYKFPATQSEYEDNVNAYTHLRDAWGQKFDYERLSDNKARLSFTTPWGEKNTILLNME